MGRHAAPDIDSSLRYAAELDLLLADDEAPATPPEGAAWMPTRRQLREARRARTTRRPRAGELTLTIAAAGSAFAVGLTGRRAAGTAVALLVGGCLLTGYVVPAVRGGAPAVLVGATAASLLVAVLLVAALGLTVEATVALAACLSALVVTVPVALLAAMLAGAVVGQPRVGDLDLVSVTVCGLLLAGGAAAADLAASQTAFVWRRMASHPGESHAMTAHALPFAWRRLATLAPTVVMVGGTAGLPGLIVAAAATDQTVSLPRLVLVVSGLLPITVLGTALLATAVIATVLAGLVVVGVRMHPSRRPWRRPPPSRQVAP